MRSAEGESLKGQKKGRNQFTESGRKKGGDFFQKKAVCAESK